MRWFSNKEIREVEQPHKEIDTSACTEVNQGIGLISKLFKLNGYGALSQSPFFAGINLIANGVAQMDWEINVENSSCSYLELNEIQKKVYDIMSYEAKTFDEIVFLSKEETSLIMITLTELELQGLIKQSNNKYYKLK